MKTILMMTTTSLTLATAAFSSGTPTNLADLNLNAATAAAVEALKQDGLTITEAEVEDGVLEIEGDQNGQEREVEIDMTSGDILSDEIENEYEDDDKDNG